MPETNIFTETADPHDSNSFAQAVPADLLERIARLALRPACPRVVIDGPSGSGKSTLAKKLASAIGAELVQLDHVYSSWDGLAAGGQHVAEQLLRPLSEGRAGRVQHWDWTANAPAGWQSVAAGRAVVVEGSAALNRVSAGLATLRIWVEVDSEEQRRKRALEQRPGGDIYAPYWDYWGAQEKQHIAVEGGAKLADIVIRPAVNEGDPVYTLLRGDL